MIKVILRKRVDRIGEAGQMISVKDGFARNFLLPQKLALLATKDNVNKIEQEKKKFEQDKQSQKQQAQKLADKLKSLSCTITAEAQDDNLYGSVTAVEIAKALQDEDIQIDKNSILLDAPIKQLGIYEVDVKLHPDVTAKVKIWVVKADS